MIYNIEKDYRLLGKRPVQTVSCAHLLFGISDKTQRMEQETRHLY